MTRASISLAVLGALLAALPAFVGNYALSVATLILYFAYTGQAWNVMMGFAGQLSLGHALYVGVGGYTAGALFYHWGIGPWGGLWVAMALCVALGVLIGFLAFVIVIVGGLGSMPGALLGGILIGVSEALAGLLIAPSAKSMFSFGLLILVLLFRPQG